MSSSLRNYILWLCVGLCFWAKVTQAQETNISALLNAARAQRLQNNMEEALRNYVQAKRKSDKLSPELRTSEIDTEIGSFLDSLGVHDKAREFYFDAYSKASDNSSKEQILTYIANSFFKSGGSYLRRSLVYYLDALNLVRAEIKKDINKEVNLLNQLARVYTQPEIDALDTAYLYRKEVLALEKTRNTTQGMASAWNNLAYTNRLIASKQLSKNDRSTAMDSLKSALKFIEKAREVNENDPNIKENKLITLINLGVMEQSIGEDAKALEKFEEVMQVRMQQNNQLEMARTHNLIAKLHFYQQRYPEARYHANQAITLSKQINDKFSRLTAYEILADVHEKIADFRRLSKYKDSLYTLKNELTKDEILAQQQQNQYKELINREVQKVLTKENEEVELEKQKAENARKEALLQTERAEKEKQIAEKNAARARAENAFIQQQKAESEARRQKAEKEKAEAEKRTALAEAEKQKAEKEKAEADRRTAEAEKAKLEAEKNKIASEKARQEEESGARFARLVFMGILGFLALIILFISIFFYKNQQKNKQLQAQKKEIEAQRDDLIEMNEEINQQKEEIESQRDVIQSEKQQSEKLLLNILPYEVAYELKEKGTATPKSYEMVSVLFTDFKGFTMATEHMNPTQVIKELDKCFGAFDEICQKYGLEKIKTIGDAYMCAGGIPIANKTNPIDAVRAGLEIQAFMHQLREERITQGLPYWELRLGINSGPLVAGVVGTQKFAYDIWGDTVNTAARMESSGEPNKVNISGATYELIKNQFECKYRGKLPAKNKGEVDMYFVLGEKK